MKAVVIYKSKTGFTKKYEEWIATGASSPRESVLNTTLFVVFI